MCTIAWRSSRSYHVSRPEHVLVGRDGDGRVLDEQSQGVRAEERHWAHALETAMFDQIEVRLLPVDQRQRQLAGGPLGSGRALGRLAAHPARPRGRAGRAVDPHMGHAARVKREVGVRHEVASVGKGGSRL